MTARALCLVVAALCASVAASACDCSRAGWTRRTLAQAALAVLGALVALSVAVTP